MRIAVVDDRPDVRDGRAFWLLRAGHEVDTYAFDEALAATEPWPAYDRIVLDGRDDGSSPAGFGAAAVPDRFVGPRVAAHIRAVCAGLDPVPAPVIILVSIHSRDHPELSWRCQEAGVDFAYDFQEVATAQTFVAVVETPGAGGGEVPPVQWSDLGLEGAPDVRGALTELETSPAAGALLSGGAVGTPYQRRALRERLGRLLRVRTPPSPSDRDRLAHESELRPVVRRLLGLRADD